jgi:hypothetical protein
LAVPLTAAPLLQPHYKVKLIVSANNTLKSIVENDMSRALLKLSDVELTDEASAAWLLYVNVVPIIDSKGVKGYIFSTVIADQYSAQTVKALPAEDFKNAQVAERVNELLHDQVRMRDHSVQTCRPEELKRAYSQIVDNFDQTYLAPSREDIQNFNLDRKIR